MSDDPHDQLLLQIRGAVAEYERTLITDRMRRGRLTKFRAGKLTPWSRTPYGYHVDPDHPRDPASLQVDLTESAIVLQMFAWYLEAEGTLYRTAKRLTDMSLPSPTGKLRWNVSTVRGIYKNPAYTGTAYSNRSRFIPAKRRRSALEPIGKGGSTTPCPPEDWIPINVPAIVSQEIFDQVQEKLALNLQTSPRNNKAHSYLLRGLVSCGHCHLSTTGRSLHGGYHYYVCRGHTDALRVGPGQRFTARYIPADQQDDLVWQDLCAVITHPEMIAYALERAHGGHWAPQELQAQLDLLKKARQQIERQQERLLEAYLADVIKLPELERKRSELSRKLEALKIQTTQLQSKTVQRIELSQITDSIETFCAKIKPTLEQANFDQKRQLIEWLIDRVIVSDNDVEIQYVVPTQPEGPHIHFCQLHSDYRIQFSGCKTVLGFRGFYECQPDCRYQRRQFIFVYGESISSVNV